jgi:hypothetical protein
MLGCPAGNPIESFIRKIEEGDVNGALALIREENPLPAVCGRVCFHPCEGACNRGSMDAPVAIHELERWVADRGKWQPPVPEKETGKAVAVVGSGPAGLTAAYYLGVKGIQCDVYEELPVLGGEVAVGVPPEKWAEAERLLESAGDDDIGVRDEGIVEACEGKPVCLDLTRSEEDVVVVRTPYGDIEASYQFKRSCPKPRYVSGEMWLDGIVKWGAAVSLSLLIASHSLSSSRSRA